MLLALVEVCMCVRLSRTYAHAEWNVFNEKRETLLKRLLFIFFSNSISQAEIDDIPFNLLLIPPTLNCHLVRPSIAHFFFLKNKRKLTEIIFLKNIFEKSC